MGNDLYSRFGAELVYPFNDKMDEPTMSPHFPASEMGANNLQSAGV